MLRDSSFLLTLLIIFSSASSSLPEKLLNSQLFFFFWNYFNKIRRLSNDCPHLEIIVNWISDRVPNYRMTTHPQFSFFCPWLSFGLLISHTTNKIAETRNKAIYMGFINTNQESPDLYVITHFWVTPKSFFLFKKKKKKKKLHGAVLNGTVQLLLPCKCRDRGEEDFWNFSRYSSLLSLHPTCPKIPHDPYPHLHNHTLQLPRHHALHLDRVWWTSPPAAYKYRGENSTKGGRLEGQKER